MTGRGDDDDTHDARAADRRLTDQPAGTGRTAARTPWASRRRTANPPGRDDDTPIRGVSLTTRRGRGQEARTSSRMASAFSSLVFSASASSETRIWRALASMRFSPARQATVLVTAPQVADDLGHLDDVAGGELLEVGLVAARPVGRLLGVGGAQHLEDLVQAFLSDDVADADELAVLGRNLDRQVALGDLELEVELVLALDRAGLDLFDECGPVVGVHDRLADLENHVLFSPFATSRIPRRRRPRHDSEAAFAQVRGHNRPGRRFGLDRTAVSMLRARFARLRACVCQLARTAA